VDEAGASRDGSPETTESAVFGTTNVDLVSETIKVRKNHQVSWFALDAAQSATSRLLSTDSRE
jgi:hypothetical protein